MQDEDRKREKNSHSDSDPKDRVRLTQTSSFVPKREESTSNTQKLDESSFDISPNSSGVMLLEQICEIKRLFEIQGRELDHVGQVLSTPNPAADRMKEIFESIKVEPNASLLNSLYGTSLGLQESSRMLISPVPNDFEESIFASSLMSMSDYQVQVTEESEKSGLFVYFLRYKWQRLGVGKKCFFLAHVPTLSI